jgi:WD40 repeat protein
MLKFAVVTTMSLFVLSATPKVSALGVAATESCCNEAVNTSQLLSENQTSGKPSEPSVRLETQVGHPSSTPVDAIAVSPDGTLIATGAAGAVILWDASTTLILYRIALPAASITEIHFSPDGKYLSARSISNPAGLWVIRIADGATISLHPIQSETISSAAWSPDGREILTGDGKSVSVWNAETGDLVRQLDIPALSLSFAPDGHLLTTPYLGRIHIWDYSSGRLLREVGTEEHFGSYQRFSHDGQYLIVANPIAVSVEDAHAMSIQVFRVETGERIAEIPKPAPWIEIELSPNSQTMLIRGSQFPAFIASVHTWIWNLETGEKRDLGTDTTGGGAAFSADGAHLFTANPEGCTEWDSRTLKRVNQFQSAAASVFAVGISKDSRHLVAGFADGSASLFDLENGQQQKRFTVAPITMETAQAAMYPSPSAFDRLFASIEDVYKEAGQTKKDFEDIFTAAIRTYGDKVPAGSVGISSDGFKGAFGGYGSHLVDTSSAESADTPSILGVVAAIAFTPDNHLITGERDLLRVWDLSNKKELFRVDWPDFVSALAVDYEGNFCAIASLSDPEAAIIDLHTGKQVMQLVLPPSEVPYKPYGITRLAFSSDGTRLFVAYSQGTIRVWDLQKREELAHHGYEAAMNSFSSSIAFAGNRAIRIAPPDRVELWDLDTGKLLKSSKLEIDNVDFPVLSRDGHRLFVGKQNGTIRIYELEANRLLATVALFKNGSWAVVAPDGRFDTNDLDGGVPLHWIVSDDPIHALPLEIFMRDYYTPRLLGRLLAGEQLPSLPSIAQLNRIQPKVSIVSVVASAVGLGDVDVTVSVQNAIRGERSSGIQDLRLFRNGHLIGLREGSLTTNPKGHRELTFSGVHLGKTVPNAPITFSAYAFNESRVKSETATQEYVPDRVPRPELKHAYVVAVGVNRIASAPSLSLQYAAADAQRIGAEVKARLDKTGAYANVAVTTIVSNSDNLDGAGKARLHQELARLASVVRPEDLVLITYSGHGYVAEDGKFYLLLSDFQLRDQQYSSTTLASALSAEELAQWILPIDSDNMALIVDACHSAASVEQVGFKPGPMGSRGLGQLAYDKRMRVLAASQPGGVALEDRRIEQGLLTYALVTDGLDRFQADWRPKDRSILLGEWLAYGVNRVPHLYEELRNGTVRSASRADFQGVSTVRPLQTPALFDFSPNLREDTVIAGSQN